MGSVHFFPHNIILLLLSYCALVNNTRQRTRDISLYRALKRAIRMYYNASVVILHHPNLKQVANFTVVGPGGRWGGRSGLPKWVRLCCLDFFALLVFWCSTARYIAPQLNRLPVSQSFVTLYIRENFNSTTILYFNFSHWIELNRYIVTFEQSKENFENVTLLKDSFNESTWKCEPMAQRTRVVSMQCSILWRSIASQFTVYSWLRVLFATAYKLYSN